jgi:hypothetical protein
VTAASGPRSSASSARMSGERFQCLSCSTGLMSGGRVASCSWSTGCQVVRKGPQMGVGQPRGDAGEGQRRGRLGRDPVEQVEGRGEQRVEGGQRLSQGAVVAGKRLDPDARDQLDLEVEGRRPFQRTGAGADRARGRGLGVEGTGRSGPVRDQDPCGRIWNERVQEYPTEVLLTGHVRVMAVYGPGEQRGRRQVGGTRAGLLLGRGQATGSTPMSGRLGRSGTASCPCCPTVASRWK